MSALDEVIANATAKPLALPPHASAPVDLAAMATAMKAARSARQEAINASWRAIAAELGLLRKN